MTKGRCQQWDANNVGTCHTSVPWEGIPQSASSPPPPPADAGTWAVSWCSVILVQQVPGWRGLYHCQHDIVKWCFLWNEVTHIPHARWAGNIHGGTWFFQASKQNHWELNSYGFCPSPEAAALSEDIELWMASTIKTNSSVSRDIQKNSSTHSYSKYTGYISSAAMVVACQSKGSTKGNRKRLHGSGVSLFLIIPHF